MRRMDARPRGCALAAMTLTLCVAGWAWGADAPAPVGMTLSASDSLPDDGTAGSANFRVTAPAGEFLADRVLDVAEQLRHDIATAWLGRELADGGDLTFIHVELCEDRDVGLALLDQGPAKPCHRIWLKTSRDRALGTTLAHEVAHVVLARQLSAAVPVWATEGVSCQYDDRARATIRQEIVARFVRTRQWPDVGELLTARSFEPTDEIAYAAAVSLTDYLVFLAGREEFVAFVTTGRDHGWDAALARHYGLENVAALETAWRRWVTDSSGVRRSQSPGSDPQELRPGFFRAGWTAATPATTYQHASSLIQPRESRPDWSRSRN